MASEHNGSEMHPLKASSDTPPTSEDNTEAAGRIAPKLSQDVPPCCRQVLGPSNRRKSIPEQDSNLAQEIRVNKIHKCTDNASYATKRCVACPEEYMSKEISPPHKCLSCKSVNYTVAFLGIFSVVLICIIIVLAVRTCEPQSHESVSPIPDCSPCSPDWPQYGGICYYFSTEERNWTSAQDFCSSHNASLTRIENKDFVMRYRGKPLYWIGLTRKDSGQPWIWLNGDPATLEVLGEGGNCAYLSDEQEVKASVSRCSTEHHWICSRPVVMMPSLGGWV